MNIFYTIREQLSKHGIFFIVCLSGVLLVGVLKEEFLLASQIIAILLSLVYYGLSTFIQRWRERIAIVFQAVLLTAAGSMLFLFLEEVIFKIILLVFLVALHSFFVFHLRFTRHENAEDIRKGMLDSMRVLTQINFFLIATLFYAPLFYFNVRFGFYYALPFLALAAALVWNIAWVEGVGMPQRMLHTCVVVLVLLEVSLAQLWLPSSYMGQALITSIVFFLMYDVLIKPQPPDSPSTIDRRASFLIAFVVLVLLVVFSQWR